MNQSSVLRTSLPNDESLRFQSIQYAHHGAITEVYLSANIGRRHGTLFRDAQQGDQLGPRDLVLTGQLAGVDIDCLNNTSKGTEYAQVTLLCLGSAISHGTAGN
tara:strand:- start:348 stop:659 length:312 start_codon:yes stop_codon:yes gene_type:complete